MKLLNLKNLCAVAGLAMLSACSGIASGAGTTFDGVWSGLITLNIGDDSCMRRENFIVKVEQAYFTGKTRDIKYKTKITGSINEDGSIRGGEFELGTVTRDAEMTGVFTGKTAEGEWESKRCKGKWTLRRIK